jgi:flagellar biosynthesis chaperone FliJ
MSEISRIEQRLSTQEQRLAQLERMMNQFRAQVDSKNSNKTLAERMREKNSVLSEGTETTIEGAKKAGKKEAGVKKAFTFQTFKSLAEQAVTASVDSFSNDQTTKNRVNNTLTNINRGASLVTATLTGGLAGFVIAAVAVAIELGAKQYQLMLKMEARLQQATKDQQRLGLIMNSMGRS